MVTTEDCKKFLAEQITKNPLIINEIWGDMTTAMSDAVNPKKWIREAKFSPTGKSEYSEPYYEVWGPMYGRGKTITIPANELKSVRRFCLAPEKYDTAVIFNVLEDKQGNLILGQYVGD